jgi:dienelactone hydrolase
VRGFRYAVALPALFAAMVWAPAAQADIPNSLKSSCATQTPAAGYSYKFCNDGLPPTGTGGINPNQPGTNAVKVPARYSATNGDDYTGLPPGAGDTSMSGADNQGFVALDVDISVPTTPPPPGGFPLIVFMHGCCGGDSPYIVGADKTDWEVSFPSFDGSRGEQWHYNNAWFASRGYVVINYTARGFVNGQSTGSTGETQLDSRRFEVNDFQYLTCEVAADSFFNIDPQKVVTTGGSYGGGFSWMALTDPQWTCPAETGAGGTSMKLAATAPRYGWTDLVDSLVPTGRHSSMLADLSAFDGADSSSPTGIPKQSLVNTLYENGKGGTPPSTLPHTTFPPYVDEAVGCLNSADPVEANPICANTLATILPSFINDRSPYYQNQWFGKIATDPSYRIPIFDAAGLTDPLFPAGEDLRMSNRIHSVVPDYPIQQYFGDFMHFVQNKAKEWGDICTDSFRHVCSFSDYPGGDLNATPNGLARTGVTTRLNRFIDHYAQPSGNPSQAEPSFDVTASVQICSQNASLEGVPADEPGPTFTGPNLEALAPGELDLDLTGTQTTTSTVSPNPHGANDDPVAHFVAGTGSATCVVDTAPAGAGVAVYDSQPLTSQETMLGATKVSIDYSTTSAQGNFQLDARLYDVFPDTTGSAVLVDRGVRRALDPSGTVTYELHGNGWRFQPGHKIRIEIAQDDTPYLKASYVPSSATITGVRLRIPTREIYPRPGSGSPLRLPLVPAYERCTSPNRSHVAPLDSPSCAPPSLRSSLLTTSPLGKGGAFARLDAIEGNPATPQNEADIAITALATDVRNKNGSDYAGKLVLNSTLRITDTANDVSGGKAGTLEDFSFGAPISCASTADTNLGSICSLTTTANALVPGAFQEGRRTVISAFNVNVLDAGPDASITPASGSCPPACGTGDERTYLDQGVFAP